MFVRFATFKSLHVSLSYSHFGQNKMYKNVQTSNSPFFNDRVFILLLSLSLSLSLLLTSFISVCILWFYRLPIHTYAHAYNTHVLQTPRYEYMKPVDHTHFNIVICRRRDTSLSLFHDGHSLFIDEFFSRNEFWFFENAFKIPSQSEFCCYK